MPRQIHYDPRASITLARPAPAARISAPEQDTGWARLGLQVADAARQIAPIVGSAYVSRKTGEVNDVLLDASQEFSRWQADYEQSRQGNLALDAARDYNAAWEEISRRKLREFDSPDWETFGGLLQERLKEKGAQVEAQGLVWQARQKQLWQNSQLTAQEDELLRLAAASPYDEATIAREFAAMQGSRQSVLPGIDHSAANNALAEKIMETRLEAMLANGDAAGARALLAMQAQNPQSLHGQPAAANPEAPAAASPEAPAGASPNQPAPEPAAPGATIPNPGSPVIPSGQPAPSPAAQFAAPQFQPAQAPGNPAIPAQAPRPAPVPRRGGRRGPRPGSTSERNLSVWNYGNIRAYKGGWAAYASKHDGLMAMAERFLRYHNAPKRGWHAQTLAEVMNIYAPPKENQTNAYTATLAKWMGINPNQRLNFDDPRTLALFIQHVPRYEHGHFVRISEAEALAAATDVLAGRKPRQVGRAPDSGRGHGGALAELGLDSGMASGMAPGANSGMAPAAPASPQAMQAGASPQVPPSAQALPATHAAASSSPAAPLAGASASPQASRPGFGGILMPGKAAAWLARIDRVEREQLEGLRHELGQRVESFLAASQDGHIIEPPASAAEIMRVFGPEQGARIQQEVSLAQTLAVDMASAAQLGSSRQLELLAARQPNPASANYKSEAAYHARLGQAISALRKRQQDDPVLFMAESDPAFAQCRQTLLEQAAHNRLTPEAVAAYTARLTPALAARELDASRLFARADAEALAAHILGAENPAAVSQSLAAGFGKLWPRALRELAPELGPDIMALSSGIAAQPARLIMQGLRDRDFEKKMYGLFKTDVARNDFDAQLLEKMDPILRTFMGGLDADIPVALLRQARILTMQYMASQGLGQDNAMDRALREVFHNRYVVAAAHVPARGGFFSRGDPAPGCRIPLADAGGALDTDRIEAGMNRLLANMPLERLALERLPGLDEGMVDEAYRRHIRDNCYWITNADESGAILFRDGQAVAAKNGEPLQFTWREFEAASQGNLALPAPEDALAQGGQ